MRVVDNGNVESQVALTVPAPIGQFMKHLSTLFRKITISISYISIFTVFL